MGGPSILDAIYPGGLSAPPPPSGGLGPGELWSGASGTGVGPFGSFMTGSAGGAAGSGRGGDAFDPAAGGGTSGAAGTWGKTPAGGSIW